LHRLRKWTISIITANEELRKPEVRLSGFSVVRLSQLLIAICLLNCFPLPVTFGCVYNVRDVGFTDIGVGIPYRLYYYVRGDTPESLISTFKQISYVSLMDSNVEVEVINVDKQTHPPDRMTYDLAMKYLDFWEVRSFPAAILVSPNGQSLMLDTGCLILDIQHPVSSIQYLVSGIVTSPKREEILSSIVKAYCVVLLIQGKDATENKKAQAAVDGAIEEIGRLMSQMPKPVEEPPRLIVIPPELFPQEKILLWSLGVNRDQGLVSRDREKPYSLLTDPYFPVVAVLYGRGRQIGPILRGERITVNGVFNILSVIGESCECGLDRGWVLGTMLPLRWGKKIQSEVAKSLGFDAESPMVKTEMSQILSVGRRLGDEEAGEQGSEYQESSIQYPASRTLSPAQFRKLVSSNPADSEKSGFLVFWFSGFPALFVGGMVLLILAGGISIILRAHQKRKGIGKQFSVISNQ